MQMIQKKSFRKFDFKAQWLRNSHADSVGIFSDWSRRFCFEKKNVSCGNNFWIKFCFESKNFIKIAFSNQNSILRAGILFLLRRILRLEICSCLILFLLGTLIQISPLKISKVKNFKNKNF